jgi:hypothetical protein
LDHLFGKAGLLTQLCRPRPNLAIERHEGGILWSYWRQFFCLSYDRPQESFVIPDVHRDPTTLTVEQELDPTETSLELSDACDGPDGVERFGSHVLDVVALRNGKNEFVFRSDRRFDGPKRPRSACPDRRGHTGEQHDISKGQDR